MRRAEWAARVAAAVVLSLAGWVASRTRDTAAGLQPPRPESRPATAEKDARSEAARSPDLGVALRLVDLLGGATYDAPKLGDGQTTLRRHWRRMKAPYVGPAGELGKLVQEVALTTSDGERPMVVDMGSGRTWQPEAQTWNMSEGSFAQRESIFAPAPATIRFRIVVPERAVFEAAPAVVGGTFGTVTFEVALSDAREGRRSLATRRVNGRDVQRWTEMRVDLAPYAGRTVDLELSTTAATPTGETPASLWGTPVVLAPGAADVGFNVLWIVVDALRPDAIASFHDDERDRKMATAPTPPLDAWLPRMPEVAPNLDALAARGVVFTRAYSGAAWTRPGTVAMLAGMRSTELGLDTTTWILPDSDVRRFYTTHPPLLPLLLRRHGFVTRAFVDNYFMIGYARAGVETGFEGADDHRYSTADTDKITDDARAWLTENAGHRFAVFCNYDSPHSPYLPPRDLEAKIPSPPRAPKNPEIRRYLAEIAKDDRAIGRLMATLEELGLRDRTLVVVTADHGETLSEEHNDTVPGIDPKPIPQRFHHASSIWEETTRVPIVLSLPSALAQGRQVAVPVQSTDLVPTILDLAKLAPDPRMSGRSLVPFAVPAPAPPSPADEVPVVVEGRGTRSIQLGRWRYVERDPIAEVVVVPGKGAVKTKDELYDLEDDPGERVNVVLREPDVVRKLRDRLGAAMARARTADAAQSDSLAGSPHAARGPDKSRPKVHLRFAGAGKAHRISGTIRIAEAGSPAVAPTLRAAAVGVADEAIHAPEPGKIEIALATVADAVVGIDLDVDPPTSKLAWELWLDDAPFPEGRVYGGPFGLHGTDLARGLLTDLARGAAQADVPPTIDALSELGLFVTRDHVGDESGFERPEGDEANQEIDQMMRQWGYAHDATGH